MPSRQVGQQARELATARAERRPQLGRIDAPRELVERLDERPVGRAHDRVAGAGEDERAARRGLGGELADEAALARAGLAADAGPTGAPSPSRARHQRTERLQLGGSGRRTGRSR